MREKARSSRSSNSSAFLVVGRVGRAVGLRGEVDVLVVSDDPERFAPGAIVLRADDQRALTVRSLRRQGDRVIVAFEEVTDRDQAEALRGAELVVRAEHARALEGDEYWDHDLIGCTVVTTGGDEIGSVTDVLHQPANEVLVVSTGSKDVLIPLVATVITAVEPRNRITIDPPPGLLEDG